MKRFLKIAVALALLACLTACTITVNVNVDGVVPVNSGSSSVTPTQSQQPDTTAPTTSAAESNKPSEEATTAASSGNTDKPAEKPTEASEPAASKELSSSSSKEEVVAKYIEVYNATKADGSLRGHDTMTCESVMIDGKENSMVRNLAGSVMKATGTNMDLPPYTDSNPGTKCATTADDVTDYSYTDNGDGTATIKLTVKDTKNSRRFEDPAGRMLNVMEDVASALADISLLTWSEGDANSNTVLTSGGYCEVTFDKNTNLMTKADYTLITVADVQHANVAIFKDKNAQATFKYVTSFPE